MAIFITQILFRFDPVILPLFFDSMAIVSSCSNARKVLYIGIEVDIYSLRECSFISIYSSHLKYSKRVKEFCLTASQFAVHADDVVLQKKNKQKKSFLTKFSEWDFNTTLAYNYIAYILRYCDL